MILSEAQKRLSQILAPCTYEEFFDNIVGRRPLALLHGQREERGSILGNDPKNVILQEFEKYAQTLTCHIHTPKAPPPQPKKVVSSSAFQSLISDYHQRGYTVRIPEVTDLAPSLSEFTRALEVVLEKPVGVVIFWSDTGAAAPIHHDEIDVIVIQLTGTKRWFISKEQATMPNLWKDIGEGRPLLEQYDTYDVKPGDLLYLPRGTAHTVQSTSESIHLSIGFVPVTVRDSVNAVLDHLSDLNRFMRVDAGERADSLAIAKSNDTIYTQIRQGLAELTKQCQSDKFIEQALAKRRARMVYELPKIKATTLHQVTSVNNLVKQTSLSISQLISTPSVLDLRLPGDLLLIHPGAELSLHYIMANTQFRVGDLPGNIGDDVRIALVNRLIMAGFLQAVYTSG